MLVYAGTGDTGLRFWRPWRTEKNEAPIQILKCQKIDFHLIILYVGHVFLKQCVMTWNDHINLRPISRPNTEIIDVHCIAGETCLHLAARLENKSIFYHLVFSLEADVNSTVRVCKLLERRFMHKGDATHRLAILFLYKRLMSE